MTTRAELAALYEVQIRDRTLDALVHQRATLPERAELEGVLQAGTKAHAELQRLRVARDTLAREVKALDDETQGIAAKAQAVNDKLYSGTVTSPRELQDLQADLDQLRAHLSEREDVELEHMERGEALDAGVVSAESALGAMGADVERLQRAIAAAEADIDAEHARVTAERAELVTAVPAGLLADYERRRLQNNGVGAALLVGDTCQGCRLSIPATEVDEIHCDESGRVFACDNCGAILVVQ